MGSTYYDLHYHWVCATKERRPLIRREWRHRFHEYLGGTIRGLEAVPLKIGGVEDHVHALIGLKTRHCLADFARELKKASSVWAASQVEPGFAWQEGYAVFTVSASMRETVGQYIDRQPEHHRKRSFVEELVHLLEKHGIEYDPKYLVWQPCGLEAAASGSRSASSPSTGTSTPVVSAPTRRTTFGWPSIPWKSSGPSPATARATTTTRRVR